MSSSVTSPSNKKPPSNASPSSKGKLKAIDKKPVKDGEVEDDDDDEDDDEEIGSGEEEDEDGDEDELEEIDPSAIIGTRRTRGVRVDYTSKEAMEKAGIKPGEEEDDDNEDEEMKS